MNQNYYKVFISVDINKKIQLSQFESVNSVNGDSSVKVKLDYSNKLINEDNLNNVLDVTDQFDVERQSINRYRIHGQLQFFSIINNLATNYSTIEDIFTRPFFGDGIQRKNISDSFRFYIVKPVPPAGYKLSNGDISAGYGDTISNNRFVRKFEVIKSVNDFDFNKAGFAKNIFNEQQYSFNVFGDINLDDQVDGFGFPLTEVFLYAEYKPTRNGNAQNESVELEEFDEAGQSDDFSTPVENFVVYEKGDIIDGDIMQLNRQNYTQRVYNNKEYIVNIPFEDISGTTTRAAFQYNPFIPIRLRYLFNDLQRVSLSSTDYQRKDDIPSHAFNLGGNNFVWRNLLDKGFLDPLTGEGVNYPFINERHYIFLNQVLLLRSVPEVNEPLLGNSIFDDNTLLQNNPTSDLDKIGDKC